MVSGSVTGSDRIVPFQIENVGIRGRLVRLDRAVNDIITRHTYPDIISRLVGEAVCLAGLLGSSLKFDGTFSLQVRGEGAVSMLLADFKSPGDLRGFAQFDASRVTDADDLQSLLGDGQFALTIDQGEDMDTYQSIVALSGRSLTECAQSYFRESEQIPTVISLAVEPAASGWRAGGIMIQDLPTAGLSNIQDAPGRSDAEIQDTWHRMQLLMSTVTAEEFTDAELEAEVLLYRLFHEDGVRAFETKPLRMKCRCSRERIQEVLHSFDRSEIADMVIDNEITVTCEFCNSVHRFDPKLLAH